MERAGVVSPTASVQTSGIHVVKWASVELHAERVDVHNREPELFQHPRTAPPHQRFDLPSTSNGSDANSSEPRCWLSGNTQFRLPLRRPNTTVFYTGPGMPSPPPYGHGARQEQGQDDLSARMRGRVRRITGSVLILPLVRDGTIAYPVLSAALVRPPPHPTDHPPRIGPALTARSPSIRDAEKERRERQPRGRRRAGGAQLRDRDGARYEHGVVQHAGLTAGGSASGMRGWARQADSARDTKHVATEADVREDEVQPTVSSLSQA
ncbi:hypothetical protein B0H14DRAFT_2576776 [Mycena olivaceomarginata]|nr:hypothetical protein B0H14DRAFT_2576776 [Mycena olivaceomarginata]